MKMPLKNYIEDSRFQLVRQNFRNLENVLQVHHYGKVDGVLADELFHLINLMTQVGGFHFVLTLGWTCG